MLRGARVLVVEDEFLVAVDLEESLRGLGCEVEGPFPSLDEALAWLETATPDAAVLDVNIRGGLAFPIAEALRDRGVPFVFCTGYADIGVVPEDLGAVATFSKPTPAATLVKALTRHMDGQDRTSGNSNSASTPSGGNFRSARPSSS